MAIYKDKTTGAIVVTDCELAGDWELVKEDKKKPAKKKAEAE